MPFCITLELKTAAVAPHGPSLKQSSVPYWKTLHGQARRLERGVFYRMVNTPRSSQTAGAWSVFQYGKHSTVKPDGWSASRKQGVRQCGTEYILNRRKPQYDCGHAESIPQIGSYRPRRRFCMIFCGALCGYKNPANK